MHVLKIFKPSREEGTCTALLLLTSNTSLAYLEVKYDEWLS